jgi:hypothetical protein
MLVTCLFLTSAARAAEESLEAVENDLAAALKEMDAMSAELGRIEEITAAPKATALRIEILKGGNLQGPVAGRLLVQGTVEEEREWSRADRESFASGSSLVFHAPLLPGTYAARFEVANPAWKTTPGANFQANVRKGETVLIKFRLSVPTGKTEPVLSSAAE